MNRWTLLLRALHPPRSPTPPSVAESSFRFLIVPLSAGMDLANPSPEPEAPAGDDYIYVHDPNPDIQSLSGSIMKVEDDLRQDEDIFSVKAAKGDSGDSWDGSKVELPEELSKNVSFLTCQSSADGGSCDVYVVGTAHVSQESCRQVEAIVSLLKPEVVFLELCPSRISVLSRQDLRIPTMREMMEMWKKKHNTFGILYGWFLAKIASRLEVLPGSEFRVAFDEAMKYGGKVILGDRPVQITLKRTWAKMPLWHKLKFLYSMVFQALFLPSPEELAEMLKEMDDTDMLTLMIQEMSKEFPTLMETLLQERDQFMSSKLLKYASESSSVVAVVGKGHQQGIKKYWKKHVALDELMELPAQNRGVSAKQVLASVGVAAAVSFGVYLASRK